MSVVKSFSVGNGDMFYVNHNSDNFTIIDCCLPEDVADQIISEVKAKQRAKGISRFISSHPDEDHLSGLELLDQHLSIVNFYCVKNSATKDDETDDFKKYCELRDSDKAFFIHKGCTRKWMNLEDETRASSGIMVHWPDTTNQEFKLALKDAAQGLSPNNISPIIEYFDPAGKFIWMGDLETKFMENIADALSLPKATVLFAPHHGRDSGKVPAELLEEMDPKIIVIGEAPSAHLNYYAGYNTITQNSAGDIIFDCAEDYIDIYVSNKFYSVTFLVNRWLANNHEAYYLGKGYPLSSTCGRISECRTTLSKLQQIIPPIGANF